jgi:putative flippase GtrA
MVGGWNTIFGFLIFVALYKLFSKIFKIDYFAYTSAQIIGTLLAVINAYIGHKYFTFKSIVRGRKMVFEFLRFSITYGLTFLISLILMPLLVEVLKIKPIIAGIFINLLVITTSYIAHSRFSFKR